MQERKKCQPNIWLLSGTGEGPLLVKAFLENGWKVSVSVVSYQASFAYKGLDVDELAIGPLNGVQGICSFITKYRNSGKPFNCVIDATHPFANEISSNLIAACENLDQCLIRYERPTEEINGAKVIANIRDLRDFDLRGKNLLFAIGSRLLPEAADVAKTGGAKIFARVLPTVEGLIKAFHSEIPKENIAILRPLQANISGDLESALCRRWQISIVICRESGGLNQRIWQSICKNENIDLCLISRPQSNSNIKVVNNFNNLVEKIKREYSYYA